MYDIKTCDCDHCEHLRYTCSEKQLQDIQNIIADPMEWYKRSIKARKRFDGTKYLLTFTRNPNSKYTFDDWIHRIQLELSKNFIVDHSCCLENLDTNVHVHSIIEVNKPIAKNQFKVFQRDYGYVDLRRVNVDNGVEQYITKNYPKNTPIKKQDLNKYLSYI